MVFVDFRWFSSCFQAFPTISKGISGAGVDPRSHGQKLATEKTVSECREKVQASEVAVKAVVEAEEAPLSCF